MKNKRWTASPIHNNNVLYTYVLQSTDKINIARFLVQTIMIFKALQYYCKTKEAKTPARVLFRTRENIPLVLEEEKKREIVSIWYKKKRFSLDVKTRQHLNVLEHFKAPAELVNALTDLASPTLKLCSLVQLGLAIPRRPDWKNEAPFVNRSPTEQKFQGLLFSQMPFLQVTCYSKDSIIGYF